MYARYHWLALGPALLVALSGPLCPATAQEDAGQESRYDKIVFEFIQYDIGQLSGQRGWQANQAFQELDGEEAIPALVRGVNRAARMQQSCPIIVISNKLQSLLGRTDNPELIAYASETLDSAGADVVYGSYVDRLREMAKSKMGEKVLDQGGTPGQLRRWSKPIESWTVEELEEGAVEDRGTRLVRVLEEMARRKGAEYTRVLARSIHRVPEDDREMARGLLAQRLTRMTDPTLRSKLEDLDPEVRVAAVRAIGYKGSPLYAELAAKLRDRPEVARYAHEVLVKMTGEDFGPAEGARGIEWYDASKRWADWAEKQAGTGEDGG